MRERLRRSVIKHALRKPTPPQISLGDPNLDAKAVLVGFSGPSSIEYRIVGLSRNAFSASYLDKNRERHDCSIPFRQCGGMDLTIRYWFRGVEMKYHSVLHYIWSMVSYEAWRKDVRIKRRQMRYNKSLKLRDDRTEILQAIVEEHLRRRAQEYGAAFDDIRIDRSEVAQLVYSDLIWGHPQHAEFLARLDLILDSLVDSGDLHADHNQRLIVKGKSVASISSRVEEDRKHKDQVNYNRSIRWLTILLLLTSIAQVLVAYSKQ